MIDKSLIRNKLIINYRLSDDGYPKDKLKGVNNENCLRNFLWILKQHYCWESNHFENIEMNIYCDNTSQTTDDMVSYLVEEFESHIKYETNKDNVDNIITNIYKISCGSSASSFKHVFEQTLENNEKDNKVIVYFIENDYIHKPKSLSILKEAFEELDASYVTLYDHPDKYIPGYKGGNPKIDRCGGEITRVFRTTSSHFKLTNSTTMSFSANLVALYLDKDIILKHVKGSYPTDYDMFTEIAMNGGSLLSSIPGYSTHGETKWLSPPSHSWDDFESWSFQSIDAYS